MLLLLGHLLGVFADALLVDGIQLRTILNVELNRHILVLSEVDLGLISVGEQLVLASVDLGQHQVCLVHELVVVVCDVGVEAQFLPVAALCRAVLQTL